jgi:hypothetical protein
MVPGNAHDLSGLTGSYTESDGTTTFPEDRLGSFGSGIAYAGVGNTYYAINDGGPDLISGESYLDRMQTFSITVTPGATPGTGTVTPTLLATTLLTNESGQYLTGNSAAFTGVNPSQNLRFDPEAIRVAPNGSVYLSDEFGPSIYQFNMQGQRIAEEAIPAKFQVAVLNANGTTETADNYYGRITNKGMEGLAITPDGKTLYGIMQSPLIQDNGQNGVNLRILQVNLTTGTTAEFLYKLANNNNVVSEILAVNSHQFLVIERDTNSGTAAVTKQIFLIDTNGATDISSIGNPASSAATQTGLPTNKTPSGVTPVSKTLFLDLLNPTYGLAGANFPKDIEGIAFGPDLSNGDHLLLVTSDNNLDKNTPSYIYAFDITPTDLPGFQAEQFSVPEPGSLLTTVTGAVCLLGYGWSRSRHRAGQGTTKDS